MNVYDTVDAECLQPGDVIYHEELVEVVDVIDNGDTVTIIADSLKWNERVDDFTLPALSWVGLVDPNDD